MLDKFNFYDIYGYFLPGALLLLLAWAPIGLVTNKWPPGDWSSAVVGVVVAYVSGLVLQMFADKAIPTSVEKAPDGHPRFPSDRFLDGDGKAHDTENKAAADSDNLKKPADITRGKLAKVILEKFGLQIADATTPEDLRERPLKNKATDEHRRDAFFQARHFLILAKGAGYAEQFQSMYALTRGLTAAMGLAFFYFAGWAISIFHANWSAYASVIAITFGMLLAINTSMLLLQHKRSLPLAQLSAAGLMVTALGVGYGLGYRYQVTVPQSALLGLAAAGAILGSLRLYSAYLSFIEDFAATVWRDFLVATSKDAQEGSASDSKDAQKGSASDEKPKK